MAINLAALSKDGRKVVIAMETLEDIAALDVLERTPFLRAWDIKKNRKIYEEYGSLFIRDLAFSPNGKQILTTWRDTPGGGIYDIGEDGYNPIQRLGFKAVSYANDGSKILALGGKKIYVLDNLGNNKQTLNIVTEPAKAKAPVQRKERQGIFAEAKTAKVIGPLTPEQIERYNLQEIIDYIKELEKR
jgi:hypothetical protein